MFRKILIAVNDDEYARKPAETGFQLARTLNAAVGIVFVIDQRLTVNPMDNDISPLSPLEIMESLHREADRTLDELMGRYAGDQPAERFTPEGRPTAEILNTAESWGADLIILGTHGRSGLMQLLTGSITTYIKHHSKIPVLIVPSEH
ncbi:universal stress protein [Compostibacter hankyongensis]